MGIRKLMMGLLLTGGLSACSPMRSGSAVTSQNTPKQGSFETPPPATNENGNSGTDTDGGWAGLKICSKLDFNGVTWSAAVPTPWRDPFAMALNISGSFEGDDGWANLTNNFDGQGISFGLLNQNLGQGSLQPMWIQMKKSALPSLQKIFSSANLAGLLGMLSKWEGTASTASLLLNEYGYSKLDDPKLVAEELGIDPSELEEIGSALTTQNQASVDWAKATVYTGTKFKTDWAQQLIALADSAPFRSIQIQKAEKLHNSAREMMASLGFKELRAYLFFFDINVQNGSISSAVRAQYLAWAKSNPNLSEKQRLLQLLEYRLGTVLAAYKADVRSRKTAIINGTGTVHGAKRDFEKEFCADIDAISN